MFDEITRDDLIMAFFPCTRFEGFVPLLLRAESPQFANYTLEQRLEYSRKIMEEVNSMYQLWCKLWLVCDRKGLKMICENPSTTPHILTQYFPVKSKVVHKDRTKYGDYYKKPTQYWFLNCEPRNNFFLEDLQTPDCMRKTIDKAPGSGKQRAIERSMISKRYANRFIREYILEEAI